LELQLEGFEKEREMRGEREEIEVDDVSQEVTELH
jgi:hypothetical protein